LVESLGQDLERAMCKHLSVLHELAQLIYTLSENAVERGPLHLLLD